MKGLLWLFFLRFMRHRQTQGCIVIFVLTLATFALLPVFLFEVRKTTPEHDIGQFVQHYSPHSIQTGRPVNKVKKILIWTKFFGVPQEIFAEREGQCVSDCGYTCSLVSNRKDLNSSDAIMFHLYDSWPENWVVGTRKLVDLPEYRDPSQVWVLSNMEPLGNLWGDFSVFDGLINWTMWYRRDATIVHPYGEVHELQPGNKAKVNTSVNYYRQKSKVATVRISNCADYARRYRIVKEFQKYIDIDTYGKCYSNPCGRQQENPNEEDCESKIAEYRFYLAFENSFCRDYVTEKYWQSISRQQIPIVNWKHVDPAIVLPRSYINVYDFPNIMEAGKYIKKVNEDETLYNSYFKWKEAYISANKCMSCRVCAALNERAVDPQVYTNFSGWVYNDYCEAVNEHNIWRKNLDRLYFNILNWSL